MDEGVYTGVQTRNEAEQITQLIPVSATWRYVTWATVNVQLVLLKFSKIHFHVLN